MFDVEAYKRRLQEMRYICGHYSQTEFAEKLGIGLKRWNHYERGYPMPRETVWKVYRVFGIPADWIWFGDVGGLSVNQWRQIKKLRGKKLK